MSSGLTIDLSDPQSWNTSSGTLGEIDNQAFAIALRWQPTDRLTADYSVDVHNRNGYGPHLQLSGVNAELAASPRAILANHTGTRVIDNPFHAVADLANGHRDTAISAHARRESIELEGHNLTLTYQFDQAEFKSITAYRAYWGEKPADFDGGSYEVPIFEVDNTESQHQWSQEFQLSGSALNSRLDYVAGLFYFREKAGSDNPQTFLYNAGFSDGGLPVLAEVHTPLRYTTDNQSVAAYTQLSYTPATLDDRLRVTGGLRYTRDEKDSLLKNLGAAGSESWSSLNPALTVEYQLGDNANIYATVSTGYNAGIFNIRATSAELFQKPVDEETLINYELGFKSEWLDRRVRLNGALFTMDFQDMHVNQFVAGPKGASNMLRNAGEARISGIELELTARVNEHLQFNAGWGHTDFDYREFITRVDETTGNAVDSADEAYPVLTPRNTLNAGVEYFFDPLSFGTISARLDTTYTGARNFHPFLTQHIAADSYSLLNGRLTLEDIPVSRGALRLSLWGKNLTDEKYRANGIDFGVDSGVLGFAGVIYGPRRSVGIDLVYEYQ